MVRNLIVKAGSRATKVSVLKLDMAGNRDLFKVSELGSL